MAVVRPCSIQGVPGDADQPWVERMRTPAQLVAAIRTLQERAPAEVRSALELEADGSFTARTGLLWAQAL